MVKNPNSGGNLLELQELKVRVETVREAQKIKNIDAKASEIALLWDFVSDIAESSGSYERNKAKFLLCSGIKSVKNGNIDIAAVKNAMQEAFCKLDESSQNGTLEIEKYDGKLIAKAGGLKLELDICW
ncbi:MAG: hypothetical protein WBR24_18840 [Desulfobacterales bacterium]|jgi:hypothetical protein